MNNFDKKISSKINGHEEAIPHHLWDGIESALPKDQDKQPLIIWLLLGFLAIFSTIWLTTQSNDQDQLGTSLVESTLDKNEPIEASTIVKTADINRSKPNVLKLDTKLQKEASLIKHNKKSQEPIRVFIKEVKPTLSSVPPIAAIADSFSEATDQDLEEKTFEKEETKPSIALKIPEHLDNSPFTLLEEKGKILGCDAFNSFNKGQIFFEFQSQLEFYQRSFSSKSIGTDDLIRLRKTTEELSPSYSAYGMMGFKQKSGFIGKAGIGYKTFRFKLDYTDPNAIQTIIHVTTDTINQPNGDVLIIYDTLKTEVIGQQAIIYNNRVRTLEIPISLGYEWDTKKWYVGANAGVAIRIASIQSGRVLSDEEKVISIGSASHKIYDESLSFAFIGQVQAGYKLNKSWSINMGMNYYMPITSISASDYALDERVSNVGLSFGLRYFLKK